MDPGEVADGNVCQLPCGDPGGRDIEHDRLDLHPANADAAPLPA